jgi:archaetidylinositol phosphate synthase
MTLETSQNIANTRSFLDKILHGITEKVAALLVNINWITPDGISWLSGIVGGLLAGWLIVENNFYLAVVAIVFSGLLDCLDGDLARARQVSSKEGGILDSVIDRYVDFLILAAIIIASPEDCLVTGLLAILGTTLVPYVRAITEAEGKTSIASIGSRATRVVLVIIGLLTGQLFYLSIVLAVISNIAAAHRLIFALRS